MRGGETPPAYRCGVCGRETRSRQEPPDGRPLRNRRDLCSACYSKAWRDGRLDQVRAAPRRREDVLHEVEHFLCFCGLPPGDIPGRLGIDRLVFSTLLRRAAQAGDPRAVEWRRRAGLDAA